MPLTADDFRSSVRSNLAEARERRDTLRGLSAEASADQVVDAFDGIRGALDDTRGFVGLYSSVHPDAEVRSAAEELEQELVAFETELNLDEGLYQRLAAVDPAACSDDGRRRMLEHSLRDYRRSGVDRDAATREKVRALQDELVQIGQTFDRQIVEGGRELKITDGVAGLAGLPEDYVASHQPDEDGVVTITTDAPDLMPFLLYADRSDLREALYAAGMEKAHPENAPVLRELFAKRHELAGVLGYENWAQYVTEVLMVRDPDTARDFVEGIIERARPRADQEYAELLEEKRKDDADAEHVCEFEWAYWVERVKKSRFGFDSQAVRPYFAYDKVEDGILRLTEHLYGVEIVRVDDPIAWHGDVRSFEVRENGEAIAKFYFDMFPRDGKFKHAAMFDVRQGRPGHSLPAASLVCNFPRPSDDDPGLLLHTQVTTFFHEVGHLFHHLFAGGQHFDRFSGISCEWDFVEVPSQLYEEWAWDADVLGRFAHHHETGEVIPGELIEKLRAAEEYGKALGVTRQMVFARLSLACYENDPAGLDLDQLVLDLKRRISPLHVSVEGHMTSSFGHLNGYSAIYYTYMWSLVISKDLWKVFEGAPLETEPARKYRAAVLAPGGARDASDLVRDFLGRDYSMEGWEAWLAS